MIQPFLLLAVVVGFILFKDLKHEARVDRLLNRIMAKNYDEFNYFEKKFDNDIEAQAKARGIAIQGIGTDEDTPEDKAVLDALEEKW